MLKNTPIVTFIVHCTHNNVIASTNPLTKSPLFQNAFTGIAEEYYWR